jgi:hypothetical protein
MQEETERGNIASLDVRRAKALDRARAYIPLFDKARAAIRARGEYPSRERLAAELTAQGVLTTNGATVWHVNQVQRLCSIDKEQAVTSTMILKMEQRVHDFFSENPGALLDRDLARVKRVYERAKADQEATRVDAVQVARALKGEA